MNELHLTALKVYAVIWGEYEERGNVVMKWTGHSDYSSMKPYIDIVDEIKASSMTKLNGLL